LRTLIDRFVTFFRASKRAGRTFVADLYLAHILDVLGRKSLPSPLSNDLRVFLPSTMKRRIIREKSFDLIAPYYPRRIYPRTPSVDLLRSDDSQDSSVRARRTTLLGR